MKKNLTLFVCFLASAILLSGCKSLTNFSVQKRQHRSGYYVDWGNGKVKTEQVKTASAAAPKQEVQKPAEPVPAKKLRLAEAKHVGAVPAVTAPEPAKTALIPAKNAHNSFTVKEEPVAANRNVNVNRSNEGAANELAAWARTSGSTPEWLLIVLCIFIPPLAVALDKGVGTEFWIDLVLALLGLGVVSSGFFGLFWLAAIIYAFVVIF